MLFRSIDAPLRGAGYDGSEYRRQMLADYEEITGKDGAKKIIRKRKPRYPVVTLFLYFGYKNTGINRWNCINVWISRKS